MLRTGDLVRCIGRCRNPQQHGSDLMYVYIASPYTHGGKLSNVQVALDTANRLLDCGYVPFVPHMTHYWNNYSYRPYEDWLEYDLQWLDRCDVLIRLPGFSPGADREETQAREWGIPVVYSVEQLIGANIQLRFRL